MSPRVPLSVLCRGIVMLGVTSLGGGVLVALAPTAAADPAPACSTSACAVSYEYTGSAQSFTVPDGVTALRIAVSGAQGGSFTRSGSVVNGGRGGSTEATVPVAPGATLSLVVGGAGADSFFAKPGGTSGQPGGFGGGGAGGASASSFVQPGTSGGGGSFVFYYGSLLLAGGGGGGGGIQSAGGAGGGVTGAPGEPGDPGSGAAEGGGAATATAHGRGGTAVAPEQPESAGGTGSGSASSVMSLPVAGAGGRGYGQGGNPGAGGGGGFFAGGGGAAGPYTLVGSVGVARSGAAGGGGSGYAGPQAVSVFSAVGTRSGNGLIQITYRRAITLTPPSAVVSPGVAQSYTASRVTEDGSPSPDVTSQTTFTISPQGGQTGASCIANSCSATQPGTYTVTGTQGTAQASATLRVRAPQAISFTVEPPQQAAVDDEALVRATGGGSGQEVTFSLDPSSTPGACTVGPATDGSKDAASLSFTGVGTCTVAADQAGTSGYDAAPTVRRSIEVARAGQQIQFTSVAPPSARPGEVYEVTATGGGSGKPVTFSATVTDAGRCFVEDRGDGSAVVTFTGRGRCVINARQRGDAGHRPAPLARQVVVVRP